MNYGQNYRTQNGPFNYDMTEGGGDGEGGQIVTGTALFYSFDTNLGLGMAICMPIFIPLFVNWVNEHFIALGTSWRN